MKASVSALLLFLFCGSPAVLANRAADQETVLPKVDEFFQEEKQSNHTLSPSGRYLAYIFDKPRAYAIRITDLDQNETIHSTDISLEFPGQLQWLDERRLIFVVKGQIWAINRDGSDLRVLVENMEGAQDRIYTRTRFKREFRFWQIASTLPDDEEHILVKSSNLYGYESIHKVNVYSGKIEVLYDGHKEKIHEWLITKSGEMRLAARTERGKTNFYRPTTTRRALTKLPRVGEFTFNYDGKSYLQNRARILGAAEQEDEIYIAENLSSDRFSIARLNISTGKAKTLVSDERYDVGDDNAGFELFLDDQTQSLLGVGYFGATWRTVWFDESLKNVQERLDKLYPNKINAIRGWDKNRTRFIFRSWDSKNYGRVLVLNNETKRVSVQNIHKSPASDKNYSARAITYLTSDNVEIEAFLYEPQNENDRAKRPLIVNPHGGPFARSYLRYDPFIAYFVSRGYVVIQPNFRGSAGYGREHLLAGKGSIHTRMIDDIHAAVRWANDQGLADSDSTFAFGTSYGGYAALMGALNYPGSYQAVASYAAPLDLKQQMRWYSKRKALFAQEFWEEMGLAGNKSNKFIRLVSPMTRLAQLDAPTLIMHGQDDGVVPVSHAEILSEKIESGKLKNPHIEVALLKDEAHSILLTSNQIYVAEKVLRTFSKAE
ncbi:MAG: prolyl oligopeptidase family serine peptidase [Pseudomonadota bacterium]